MARPELITPPLTPERIVALSLGRQISTHLSTALPKDMLFVLPSLIDNPTLCVDSGFTPVLPNKDASAIRIGMDREHSHRLYHLLSYSPALQIARTMARSIAVQAIGRTVVAHGSTIAFMHIPGTLDGYYKAVIDRKMTPGSQERQRVILQQLVPSGPSLTIHGAVRGVCVDQNPDKLDKEFYLIGMVNFGNSARLHDAIRRRIQSGVFDPNLPMGFDLTSVPEICEQIQSVNMVGTAPDWGMLNRDLQPPSESAGVPLQTYLQLVEPYSILLGAIREAQRLGPMK